MTSSRRRKRDVRERAESAGTNYTPAPRHEQLQGRQLRPIQINQPDAETAERDMLGQLRDLWPAACTEPQQIPHAPAGPGPVHHDRFGCLPDGRVRHTSSLYVSSAT
jgi:hypothetical protein